VDKHKDLPEEVQRSNRVTTSRCEPLYWLCYSVTDSLAFKYLILLIFVGL